MRYILFVLLLTLSSSYGIELIIGDKVYYIDEYKIKNNGQRIEIPKQVYLAKESVGRVNTKCTKALASPKKTAKSNGYNSLLKSVRGKFNQLNNQFKSNEREKNSKKNFR